MARAVFRATVRARNAAQQFARAPGRIERHMRDELEDEFRDEAEDVLRERAPVLTSRLHDGISARPYSGGRIGFEVTAEAVDPRTGFDYVGVTRIGHRRRWIYPKHASRIAFFSLYIDRWVNAARVRGHQPASDWVEDSMPALRSLAAEHSRSLARRIETRLL